MAKGFLALFLKFFVRIFGVGTAAADPGARSDLWVAG
jgi:hypothetical protein